MNGERGHEDLIELGAASIETKGGAVGYDDYVCSLILPAGLSDE